MKNKIENNKNKTQFNAGLVNKMVFSEALQNPFTIYPAAVSILGILYMALISFDQTSFSVTAAAAFFSSLSFVFQYFIKGEETAENIIKQKLKERKENMINEWIFVKNSMLEKNFVEGAKEVQELNDAFVRLVDFLNEKFKDKGNLTAQRFIVLSEETYSRGIFLLKKALEVHSALGEINEKKLKEELEVFENNLMRAGKEKDISAVELEAIQIKINSHKRRLDLFLERHNTLQELLAQCETLEATLDSTYLEVVDLLTYDSKTELTNATSKLEKAVASARKAEQRIRGITDLSDDKDSIYLMENNE